MKKEIWHGCPLSNILLVVVIVLLAYTLYASLTFEEKKCPECPSLETPKYTAQAMKTLAARIAASYPDWWFLVDSIPTPAYSPYTDLWSTDIILTRGTASETLHVVMYDENYSLKSISSEFPAPSKLSNDPIVARGIIQIFGKNSCAVDGKPKVIEFADPYDPWSIAHESIVQSALGYFGNSIEFEYKICPSYSYNLFDRFGKDNVSVAYKYFYCAKKQGKLDGFKKCAIDAYNLHRDVPLNGSELDACAVNATLDSAALNSCLPAIASELEFDGKLADTYLDRECVTPSVVVNCQYRSPAAFINKTVCYAAPDIPQCKQSA